MSPSFADASSNVSVGAERVSFGFAVFGMVLNLFCPKQSIAMLALH